ncbi:MAG: hypothetical protein ABII64_03375 [Elusimicrobiota bacterium]
MEEKTQKKNCSGNHITALTVLNIVALIGLAGIVLLSRSARGERKISLEDLRRAYSGLDPEEIEEMKYI